MKMVPASVRTPSPRRRPDGWGMAPECSTQRFELSAGLLVQSSPMENRFHRDLRVLMAVGGGMAALILAAGLLGLRGAMWEEGGGVVRELVIYAAVAVGVMGLAGTCAWWVVRRSRRGPPTQT